MSHSLNAEIRYSGSAGAVTWEGHIIVDEDAFRDYLRDVVGPRVRDEEDGGVREVLLALATTGMEIEFVEELLNAVPPVEPWEVGEALAECILRDIGPEKITWPWNRVADRRTPRASLPGADLVGFLEEQGGATLVFGEIKTSSERSTPPSVMYGGSGMTWQLADQATNLAVHHALLFWLLRRCTSPETQELYRSAVKRYVESRGTRLLLLGVLLRDTTPAEADVRSRAQYLQSRCSGEMRVRVTAWYCPVPIEDWPRAIDRRAA